MSYAIAPLRRLYLRQCLRQTLSEDSRSATERGLLLQLTEDVKAFRRWADAIADAHPRLTVISYADFLKFIEAHWTELVLLAIKIAVICFQEHPDSGEQS